MLVDVMGRTSQDALQSSFDSQIEGVTMILRLAFAWFIAVLSASAGSAQGKIDCGAEYKGIWEKFNREKFVKLSGEQVAGLNRIALRAYDSCHAADEQGTQIAKDLFEKLRKMTR
jgi:hypothetical protein